MDLMYVLIAVVVCVFIVNLVMTHSWTKPMRWLIISPVILVVLFGIWRFGASVVSTVAAFYAINPLYGLLLSLIAVIFVFIAYKSLEHINHSAVFRKKKRK